MITPGSSIKRAHFVGIGGAGMSGIALVLHVALVFFAPYQTRISTTFHMCLVLVLLVGMPVLSS